jgi:peptide/nickel transport system ATP-binding protein
VSSALTPGRRIGDEGRSADSHLAISGLTLSIGSREILAGVDLVAAPGQVTGLAGESGSGKTMTGMTVCGLQPKTAVVGGSITFGGTELVGMPQKQLNRFRGAEIAMVFQDPTASLHPLISIGGQLTDHMKFHLGMSGKEARARARDLLAQVKVPDPAGALDRYPHQFSGGQLQRIAIASALACHPSLLIADEPTTALDVTVQAGILRLLRQLCDDLGIGIILITHDLGVMSALADTIAVMRVGTVVEHGSRYDVIRHPQHPYTQHLISSLPGHQPVVGHASEEPRMEEPGTDQPSTDGPSMQEPGMEQPDMEQQ